MAHKIPLKYTPLTVCPLFDVLYVISQNPGIETMEIIQMTKIAHTTAYRLISDL